MKNYRVGDKVKFVRNPPFVKELVSAEVTRVVWEPGRKAETGFYQIQFSFIGNLDGFGVEQCSQPFLGKQIVPVEK